METFTTLPLFTSIIIGAIYSLSPWVLLLLELLVSFWDRAEFKPKLFCKFQKMKWHWSGDTFDRYSNEDSYFTATVDLFVGSLIGLAAYGLIMLYTSVALAFPITIILLCIVIIPRYIKDLIKTLKYNTKTRDSDRLVKLEQEISELKGKN